VTASKVLTEEQKNCVREKLSNRINSEGMLQVKSQSHRTQLANKDEAIEKIIELVSKAIEKKKPRIANSDKAIKTTQTKKT
jgi:ribosome-associated protein